LDAPIGYLSSFQALCEARGIDFDAYLSKDSDADLHHFIGKDIVNFHGLFWPAVLKGAGMRAPTRLHVNGYLTVDGAKMSKSRGTFVMARTYLDAGLAPEALRYYFATKTSGGVDDLDLNLGDFVARVNSDVVGKFVNLASRCAGFIEKRFNGELAADLPEPEMYTRFVAQLQPIAAAYARNEAATALRLTMALADEANQYIDAHKPWVLAKQEGADAELQAVCTQGLNLFRVLSVALAPVMPRVAWHVEVFLAAPVADWSALANPLIAHRIQAYSPLFTRIDPKHIEAMIDASKDTLTPVASAPAAAAVKPATAIAADTGKQAADVIGIDDFAKLDLRIGKVLECGFVEGSDKLLRFLLDAGELGQRQIFSGIRASYAEPDKLIGRNVVFIANLAPRKMRFGISEGMILSAGFEGGGLSLLDADAGAQPGMPVK
ncbi:MAG: methionine--tRNA ligase subunit beta, partial [Thermomonas sp.]